jgi:thiosulfate dehydrogenase [quinone] large subunit
MRWELALVEIVLGYEWLLSGLNKLLSPHFRSGLAQNLQQSTQGNPNGWYVAPLRQLVLPHAPPFAVVVLVSELLIGLGYLAGAGLWLSGRFPSARWSRLVNMGVIAALVGSAGLSANYYIMSGFTLPGLDTGAPFQEGLDIDGLLALIALVLVAAHCVAASRGARAAGRD